MKFFLLIIKNLRRNLLRTILTSAAIMILVFMVTLIWTVVFFLDSITEEKSKDLKLIITEKWQLPSQMPLKYANYLDPSKASCILDKNDVGPNDFMTWSFYGGTTKKGEEPTRDNLAFFFVMDPDKIRVMMDDLENYDPALIEKMKKTRNGTLLGRKRMEALDKRVGETFKLYSINYKDVDLEFKIVGQLPDGRYDLSGIMNHQYFEDALLEDYPRTHNGNKHPLADRALNLIWLRVPDKETFERVAARIESHSAFKERPIKCQTASAGIASFLDAYRDLMWGMKWLLVPAMLGSMTLVVSNAISISVRERRAEMAVLKVLGFRPGQILILVLGEALLVGALAGLTASGLTIVLINFVMGGIPFPIAFFPAFLVPNWALLWGFAMGTGTSLLGSILPAWSARTVKVSEVFSKVA